MAGLEMDQFLFEQMQSLKESGMDESCRILVSILMAMKFTSQTKNSKKKNIFNLINYLTKNYVTFYHEHLIC